MKIIVLMIILKILMMIHQNYLMNIQVIIQVIQIQMKMKVII